MNNFRRQHLFCECKMDFPIATRIPSFENSFWIYMPDSSYQYSGREASAAHTSDLQSILLYTPSLEATKCRERPPTCTGTDW